MAVPARISLITLGVADVARSTAFFEALGWVRSSVSQESVTFIRTADSVLGLWSRDSLAGDMHLPTWDEAPEFRGFALAINLESEAEVDRVMAEAVAAGATVLKAPERVFWGGYSGYFADLDGFAWEVAFNPGFPFTAEGSLDLPE